MTMESNIDFLNALGWGSNAIFDPVNPTDMSEQDMDGIPSPVADYSQLLDGDMSAFASTGHQGVPSATETMSKVDTMPYAEHVPQEEQYKKWEAKDAEDTGALGLQSTSPVLSAAFTSHGPERHQVQNAPASQPVNRHLNLPPHLTQRALLPEESLLTSLPSPPTQEQKPIQRRPTSHTQAPVLQSQQRQAFQGLAVQQNSLQLPLQGGGQGGMEPTAVTATTAETSLDAHTPSNSTRRSPPRTPQSTARDTVQGPRAYDREAVKAAGDSKARTFPASRVTKPRDKYAKLRRRLNCCTQQQLSDMLISLVRSSTVPEKTLLDITPSVNIEAMISKCDQLKEHVFAMLPDVQDSTGRDSSVYKKCRKTITSFKTEVQTQGKILLDAQLWDALINFCVRADVINEQMPTWDDPNNNKFRATVHHKLQSYVNKAFANLMSGKPVPVNVTGCLQLAELCKASFPDNASKVMSQLNPNIMRPHLAQQQIQPHPSHTYNTPGISRPI